MKSTDYRLLLLISVALTGLLALWIQTPGYMDADYYFATARRIADGYGFSEPFLWNYLDSPLGIPHPSHLYWMPLTSVLSAGFLMVFGDSFGAAQLPSILITLLIPIMTAGMAFRFHGNERWAWQTGLLAIFSGFYLPFMVTTDTFALFTLLGSLTLWLMAHLSRQPSLRGWLLSGLLIGMANLTRADGLLLLVPAILAVLLSPRNRIVSFVGLIAGFMATMGLWWVRNLAVSGSIVSPAGDRILWLLEYNEIFAYPADFLTFDRWSEAGFLTILAVRFKALFENLLSLIAVNGVILLGPFMVLGAVQYRNRRLVLLGTAFLLVLLLIMSFIFPFIGSRGAFFHSSTAVMPILWVLGPVGLDIAISWWGERRGWDLPSASRVLANVAIVIVAVLSIRQIVVRVIAPAASGLRWNQSFETYQEVGRRISTKDSSPGVVAVNNPPGFYLASELEAIVIPNGSMDIIRDLADRFAVEWVVLEANHPHGLDPYYESPVSTPWLEFVETFIGAEGSEVHLFQLVSPGSID